MAPNGCLPNRSRRRVTATVAPRRATRQRDDSLIWRLTVSRSSLEGRNLILQLPTARTPVRCRPVGRCGWIRTTFSSMALTTVQQSLGAVHGLEIPFIFDTLTQTSHCSGRCSGRNRPDDSRTPCTPPGSPSPPTVIPAGRPTTSITGNNAFQHHLTGGEQSPILETARSERPLAHQKITAHLSPHLHSQNTTV